MSKGRMISSEIWEDDYFIELSLLERMIWIGLLTCSADDQGRLQDNARLIHSQLFPVDDLEDALIEQALSNFAQSGKIIRYAADGKRIIQILNWWKHQSPRWAGKSKYTPPPGWVDRERYHSAGNELKEKNWKSTGGFIEISNKDSKAGYIVGNTTNDVNVDVNDDVKVKVNDDVDVDVPPGGGNGSGSTDPLLTTFRTLTKLPMPEDPHDRQRWDLSFSQLHTAGVSSDILSQAILELQSKKYKIAGPWSVVKGAIICLDNHREAERRRDSDGIYRDLIHT